MTVTTLAPAQAETLADLVESLGSIPLERIAAVPPPGTATEADLLRPPTEDKRLYELIDGVLVEKPRGYYESLLTMVLGSYLRFFVRDHNLGFVLAPDGPLRLSPAQVRLPDLSFLSWDHFPTRKLPRGPVLDRAPDLAIEILSTGNTEAEMARKLREYFAAGTRLAWLIDSRTRTARVYTSPEQCVELGEDGVLDGDHVLPGFRLSLRQLFEEAGERSQE
jgi:Uma2 family endonuclease